MLMPGTRAGPGDAWEALLLRQTGLMLCCQPAHTAASLGSACWACSHRNPAAPSFRKHDITYKIHTMNATKKKSFLKRFLLLFLKQSSCVLPMYSSRQGSCLAGQACIHKLDEFLKFYPTCL